MNYNNSVLIGNWSEERLKNEYEFKVFLRRRDRKELLLQKSRNLFSNLLKERPLAISGLHILYGYNVQVVASDMPGICTFSKGYPYSLNPVEPREILKHEIGCREMSLPTNCKLVKVTAPGEKPKYGLALSSLVTDRQVDFMQNINDGCLMTLSPIITPCCRNTFVILNTEDESLRGVKMNYGEEFLLRSENYGDPSAAPLYVRYTPEGVPGPADRMPIRLSAVKDSNCRWSTSPLLSRDRLEGLGSPVPTGAKLLLKNCVADKSLCVMNQCWMKTFFGPECGVTCRNFINIHKMHTAENVFTLVSDIATKSKN